VLPVDPASMGETAFLARLARGELHFPRPSLRAAEPGMPRRAGRTRVPGDLDSIVMKALEPDRARRYATALSLAEDLGRYLREEPVAARPPLLAYRLKKYLRRHRVPATAAAVAVLGLTGGAVAAGVGVVRATRAEALARQEAATASEVSQFLTGLFSASDPNLRSTSTLREVVDRGAVRVREQLKAQPRVQARLFETLSHVYGSLGVHREAAALAEEALALDAAAGEETRQTADAALTLGRSRQILGDFDGARMAYERALAIHTRLAGGENDPGVAVALSSLGALHGQLERYEEAVAAHSRALAIQQRLRGPDHIAVTDSLRGLALVHGRTKNYDAALELDRQVLAIRQKTYGDGHPLVASALEDVAWDLRGLKRPAEARSFTERALEMHMRSLGPDHPKVAFTHHLRGLLLEAEGQTDEAISAYREALRIRETALGRNNPRTADVLVSIAVLQLRRGRMGDGRQLLERAVRTFEKVYGPTHSKTVHARTTLAEAVELMRLR
jgi:tetratricopeptide (TPR) repeat protein